MLKDESRIDLPVRPADQVDRAVAGWQQPVVIDSYVPEPPDRYPAYLDRRIYQGSSGKVYPLPFFERISPDKVPVTWQAVHLENRWIRLMILPELGGRIHIGQDLSNGYDFFYRNEVIKPALIGLTGPWIAGGVEFNWPQHHRPATYLPTDVSIEYEEDGAVTVWCSDHDPFTRMKGMHGIRLHPDRAVVEARVRLYNRDDRPQTFLWWANVAARAHADYQSFFPTDVQMVADHAKRAVTSFPAADRPYYDIDYPARHDQHTTSASGVEVAGDRIDWYRNIPVPTSYMCLDSADDFFGGYDHAARAGFVHVADHHLSVGKKQWTWGNDAFGRAWDRNLADDDAAYVELMAGVFTDNQPDFSFIAPGETKVFSQFWYPIQEIGPVRQATVDAALSLEVDGRPDGTDVSVGVTVTAVRPGARVELCDRAGTRLTEWTADLEPGRPVRLDAILARELAVDEVVLTVRHGDTELLHWEQRPPSGETSPATEPPAPEHVDTVDELYRIGMHLAQYRQVTRAPEPYWREALRRDPAHPPSCVALAGIAYGSARYADAEALLRPAIERQTMLNPNPSDTGAFYLLGLTLLRLERADEAYDAFGKAVWDRRWRAPAGFQLALLDAAAGRHAAAASRLDDVLRSEPDHLQARSLRVLQLRHLGQPDRAKLALTEQLLLDPLDWWARDLAGETLSCDAQTCLDVALEYERAGEPAAALRVLDVAVTREQHRASGAPATGPLLDYLRARNLCRLGRVAEADELLDTSRSSDDRYCFPSRLDEADLLRDLRADRPDDPRPHALLGHWLYAVGRRGDAQEAWRRAVELQPSDSVAWRNLGLVAYNHRGDLPESQRCYDRAVEAAPAEARLWFERDQLAQRAGMPPHQRLTVLEEHLELLQARDDASLELAHLYLSLDRPEQALGVLQQRSFQPWEGGEGQVLAAWDRMSSALARRALPDRPGAALALLDGALDPPDHLGEGRHPLANTAGLHLLRGDALSAAGRHAEAVEEWSEAAGMVGDFLSMSSQPFSEATFASIRACQRLGDEQEARRLTDELARFCDELEATPAVLDYFATSLPSLLLFTEDAEATQRARVTFLRAQVEICRGHPARARALIDQVLALDPNHAGAVDLLRFEPGSSQASTGTAPPSSRPSRNRPT